MRDSLREDDSPRESIEIDKKRCTVLTVNSTVHNNKEQRTSVQIRMKKSIHRVVGDYCGKNMSYGEFYEKAAQLFIQVNPKEFSPLMINNYEEKVQVDLQDKVQELICIDDLNVFLGQLKNANDSPGSVKFRRKKYIALMKECKKLKEWGVELSGLIEEVSDYFA